jgi:hypothetical protein
MNDRHDISANVVKIDYAALLETAKIAKYASRNNVERALGEIQHNDWRPCKSMKLTARKLANDAQALALAIETVEALEVAEYRDELVIVGKPDELFENVFEDAEG